MLTVYGRRSSSNVQLVMWTINELGLEHTRLDYGHGFATTDSPDYLEKNPMGQVPVLEDKSLVMFESAAILRYLSAKYGDESFWPSDPAKRAELDIWAEWGKSIFTYAVLEIFVYDVRLAPETRDPKILEAASEKVSGLAKILANRLKDGPWIAGDNFSFADIACGHILYRYFSLDWTPPDLPQIASYYDRLQKRPAFAEHVMVSYEPLRGSY